jgi:hypothetical protein
MGKDTVKEYSRRLREIEKRFRKQKLPTPPKTVVHPRITVGSLTQFLVPPYWNIWTWVGARSVQPSADKTAGTFSCYAQGNGGQSIGGAGIAAAYFPISDQPMGHFRPFLEVSWGAYDASSYSTAHSNGFLNAEVMEYDQAGNLVRWPPYSTYIPPVFQGSSSGNDTYGPTGGGPQYAGYIDVPFPLTPGHGYALWVYNNVEADDAGFDFWGFGSIGDGGMSVSCPFIVVEEAQS